MTCSSLVLITFNNCFTLFRARDLVRFYKLLTIFDRFQWRVYDINEYLRANVSFTPNDIRQT